MIYHRLCFTVSGIPVIAMSANSFTEDIINSRISGMNRHIAKPLDMKKLINTIEECVGEIKKEGSLEKCER